MMDKRLLIVPQVNLHRILCEPGSNITFLGLMLDESDRYELGWSFIVFFALYFVLHGAFLAETAITKVRTTKRSLKIMKAKIASG